MIQEMQKKVKQKMILVLFQDLLLKDIDTIFLIALRANKKKNHKIYLFLGEEKNIKNCYSLQMRNPQKVQQTN